jgi:acetyl esterase/lipase
MKMLKAAIVILILTGPILAASRAQTSQSAGTAPAQQNSTANPTPGRSAASAGDADVSVQKDVSYGSVNGQNLLLDVFAPVVTSGKPRPAVILIHGGGWTAFDKGTLTNMGRFLARFGYVAFSVNYRLLNGSENQWPAQLDDVQRSVRWVRAHAAQYNVDPEHIGAWGHSAGAQLASLLGMENTRDNSDATLAKYSSRVQAVVDVSGPTDFTTNREPDDAAFLAGFFGADYATKPQIWRDASPVFHVAKDVAPFLILHGTKDADVPISQAEELAEKLQNAGVPVKLVKVDDVHTFTTPEARRALITETLAFYHQYLGAGEIE